MHTENKSFQALPLLLLTALAIGSGSLAADEGPELTLADLTVLDTPAKDMMKNYLTSLVDEQFAQRDAALSKLHTAEDWMRHAEYIRESMAAWTGDFPERTPLNARVTGRVERQGYVMEKILFESRPRFLVSANLYLPKGGERRPAVLNLIGHSPAGKASEKVQRRSIAQAKKGFVSFTIDAIGQGERQIAEYVAYGKPPGNAHQILGRQAFLAGTHVFNFMAWDVIRAVDYLVSRPEVDPARIACTGCSGGGMMTTYILPFEPRITVAIPACNPNTWSHRVHANLATDHEQVFPGAFAARIDPRGDPLFCHVPKPLLINATSNDNLNPTAGVWELNGWLEKAYAAHHESERFKTTMVDAPHGYNLEQREIAYAWMLKWLGGDEDLFREGDFPIEAESDTWCTSEGNVYAGQESRQPHDLVLDYLRDHRPSWPPVDNAQGLARHKARLKRSVKRVLDLPDRTPLPEVTEGTSRSSGKLRLTPIAITPEKGVVLPGLWIESGDAPGQGPVILYVHDRGKASLAGEPLVERLVVSECFRILAVDLRGMGETAPGLESKFWDFLAGKPIFAQRVGDIRSILCWLSEAQVGSVQIWAQGVSATCASIAAVMDENVSGLVLEEPLVSFESVVTVDVPTYRNDILVPGILERFDFPQAYQAGFPRRVTLINPLRGDQRPASGGEIATAYQSVSKTYQALGQPTDWRVFAQIEERERSQRILSAFIPP
jgi:dienelactone hydrolase